MKFYCIGSFLSVSLSFLSFDVVADITSDETKKHDPSRDLAWRQSNKRLQMKRHNARRKYRNPNNQREPDDWKVPNNWNDQNDWKQPNDWKSPKENNHIRLAMTESDCTYNYVSSDSNDGEEDFPIDLPGGEPNTAGTWKAGSYVFKSCELFNRGNDNMYYGPLKAGQTSFSCLVTKVTDPRPGNDAVLECTIADDLVSSRNSKYSYVMGPINHDNNDMYSSATLRSHGTMQGWESNFKAATVGGTGGGIMASGQMQFVESEYSGQHVHFYYIDAPYFEKGFSW